MPARTPDRTWPDAQRRVDQAELARLCSLSPSDLDALVEFGTLVPLVAEREPGRRQFSAGCIVPLREAARLRRHYNLDLFTVSLLLAYLQRIAQLEQQLRTVQPHPLPPQLPREGPTPWREPHAHERPS